MFASRLQTCPSACISGINIFNWTHSQLTEISRNCLVNSIRLQSGLLTGCRFKARYESPYAIAS